MIDVNLRAPLVLMHLALPHLAKSRGQRGQCRLVSWPCSDSRSQRRIPPLNLGFEH